MRIGISVYDLAPAEALELASAADGLGFDGIWLAEHLLYPVRYQTAHPSTGMENDRRHATLRGGQAVTAETELPDTWALLGALASSTSRLNLYTGIYILPARHPLLTARAAATIAEMSAGRFVFGVGLGWLAEEFYAIGVAFSDRASIFEESIPILRTAWKGKPFSHAGRHWTFPEVQIWNKEVSIPLVFAGNSESALQRAARLADGWYVSGIPSIGDMLRIRRRLLEIRDEVGATSEFRCYLRLMNPTPKDLDTLEHHGVEDIVLLYRSVWPEGSLSEKIAALGRVAKQYGLANY